jgi:hypothetical protein
VFDLAASDDRLDSAFPDEPAVLVVVVAAVGDQRPRPANAAADMWYAVEQLEQLGDVVAVDLAASDDRLTPRFQMSRRYLSWPAARPANAAADMWYAVEQLEQLGDVVAVELIVNGASVGRVWGLP